VVLLGVISGLITSMLTPFLPVIIKNSGFSITSVGVLMAVITLVWVIVFLFISGEKIHHRKVLLFTGSQILTGVVVLLLMVKFPPLVVIAILVLRSVFLSVSIRFFRRRCTRGIGGRMAVQLSHECCHSRLRGADFAECAVGAFVVCNRQSQRKTPAGS
jgi:cyanate permease